MTEETLKWDKIHERWLEYKRSLDCIYKLADFAGLTPDELMTKIEADQT
jgi:hypothetical protein